MEITWNKNIEPENKAEIERQLTPLLWLVPNWCQLIHVNLFGGDKKTSVETITDYDYRFIQIDVYTLWLNESPETRRENFIHELIHGFVNVLYYQARRAVIATAGDNEQLQEFALSELAKTVESVTQDLTFAIANKFRE